MVRFFAGLSGVGVAIQHIQAFSTLLLKGSEDGARGILTRDNDMDVIEVKPLLLVTRNLENVLLIARWAVPLWMATSQS